MIAQADQPELRQRLAAIFRPSVKTLPSEWAERHRRLKKGTTPQPGRWRNDYLPWLKPILDAFVTETWAEGVVVKKPAQVGASELMVTLIGYLFSQEPGPTLFVATTQDIAREFAIDRFDHMIDSTPELRSVFLRGKANRETTFIKPAVGGNLLLAGAGSPNKLISRPCRYVFLDEEDRLPVFPNMGSARSVAEKRTREYGTRVRTGIFSIGHPTVPDVGVALTYDKQSDRREWMLDCPHCALEFAPAWDHVTIDDKAHPEDARYNCPACAEELTDAQRWAATRRGRFVSTLEEGERTPRFVGFHFSRLCHPRVTLAELAEGFVNCENEADLRVFYNMELGLEYQEAAIVLTTEAIKAKVDARGTKRQAPADTRFITLGADVQKGRTDVVLYVVIPAWTSNGNAVILDFAKLLGWEALDAMLRRFEAAIVGSERPLRIRAAGIDYGWHTREVYTFCRQPHAGIPCVPMKHEARITRQDPTRIKKTKDPLHAELTAQQRLELCRDHWLDRCLGRFQADADPTLGGSVVLPPHTSPEFIQHIKANRQVEIVDRHQHIIRTWERDKRTRDDFAQAFLYAEVAAVGLGLDSLHEAVRPTPAHEQRPETRGHVSRVTREARPGGYIRGRRGRRR